MNANITIISRCDGEVNSCFTDGDIFVTDNGFILSYLLDGKDENNLVYNGKSISQSRSGGLTYSIEFIQGRKCPFLFKEMGLSFSHEVFVDLVEVTSGVNGYKIQITYSECDSPQGEVTSILVSATYKKS